MRIEHYSFGAMTVGTATYRRDLIILGSDILPDWLRTEGHRLGEEDLGEVLQWSPEVLVVGTGAFGRMEVPAPLLDLLRAKGIEVRRARTSKAAEIFNDMSRRGRRVAGAFHLTC